MARSNERAGLAALSKKIDRKKYSLARQTVDAERLMKSEGMARDEAMAEAGRRHMKSDGGESKPKRPSAEKLRAGVRRALSDRKAREERAAAAAKSAAERGQREADKEKPRSEGAEAAASVRKKAIAAAIAKANKRLAAPAHENVEPGKTGHERGGRSAKMGRAFSTRDPNMKRTMHARGKVDKVMGEFKRGTLKSSSGQKVTSRDQATAIAMSESGQTKKRRRRGVGRSYIA